MDFKTLVERMHEASDSAGTPAEIVGACAKAALDLLGVPEGWPKWWVVSGNKAQLPRGGQSWAEACVHVTPFSEGGYYVSVESACLPSAEAAMEAGRCAVWAMEGCRVASTANRPPTVNRETLAHALHDAYVADKTIVWGECCEDVRQGYLREADEAIRLCAGADAGARIADLEQRNATLTATANAAVERAEAAEGVLKFMEGEVARMSRERDAATAHATQMQTDRREMIDHAERLLKRAEEAEVRAARAEKALRLSADAAEAATTDEEDALRELYDTRAENDRLRRAIYIATQATAHMSTVAALLTGEADDA